ncbi:hypothetical protein [Hoeflea sp.]
MKKQYEAPVVSKRGKLANATALKDIEPDISGITFDLPDLPD